MRKRICLAISVFVCFISLAACGKTSGKSDTYFDIQTETEQLFDSEAVDFNSFMLGTQFYHNEPVQLWLQRITDENLHAALDIYLCKSDGSRELIAGGIDTSYRSTGWYLGEDDCFYIPYLGEMIKLDSEGRELYRIETDGSVQGICQTDAETLALLIGDGLNITLSRLDSATGVLSSVGESMDSLRSGKSYLGGCEGAPLLLNGEGIWKVDIRTGEKTGVLEFKGTSYGFDTVGGAKVCAFRMTEDNAAEILYEDGRIEYLRLTDVSADRTVVRIRTANTVLLDWLKSQAVRYNRQSEEYYVVIDSWDKNTDIWDFREQTAIQIAAGKGADIICGSAVLLNAADLIDKGVFEDLSPYIERSAIREEEYFPMVFDSWRDGDKIYSINPVVHLMGGYAVDRKLLSGENPEMEELLDVLLDAEEKAVLNEGMTASMILHYFLRASEDLWGMIDWEEGTCDFDSELFQKLLEVAAKYGDSDKNNYPEAMTHRNEYLYGFITREELEKEGKTPVGYFFDGGCGMGVAQNYVLGMNSKSPNKEGAWEFMAFLLAEEAQSEFDYASFAMNRKAFDAMLEREYAEGAKVTTIVNGRARTRHKGGFDAEDLTRERGEALKREIEAARAFPVRTEPILDIILEEAGGYFDGGRNWEEVCHVIENRVNLYLKERR